MMASSGKKWRHAKDDPSASHLSVGAVLAAEGDGVKYGPPGRDRLDVTVPLVELGLEIGERM